MSCLGCVGNISGVLGGIAGVAAAEVSLADGEARVSYDPTLVDRAALVAAIEDAGFDAA
jgi:copper chaperone